MHPAMSDSRWNLQNAERRLASKCGCGIPPVSGQALRAAIPRPAEIKQSCNKRGFSAMQDEPLKWIASIGFPSNSSILASSWQDWSAHNGIQVDVWIRKPCL